MDALKLRLLNQFQRGFPLAPRPFAQLAQQLATGEAQVLKILRRLKRDGAVSRVGAVFQPNCIGASSLAAMAVPAGRVEHAARIVSGFPEVNHNYEREHRYNLWFVACARDRARLQSVLQAIARDTGYPLLSLPLLEQYHLDLGFDLEAGPGRTPGARAPGRPRPPAPLPLEPWEERLVAALQVGFPLVRQPYAELAAAAGAGEAQAIATLERWQSTGIIRRIGVIVRHRALGFAANAMTVWDVPDSMVAAAGACLSRHPFVTLCYRRARQLPDWRYNLFCMIHGRDRDAVLAQIAALDRNCRLAAYPRAVLFSRRCFKQEAARYRDGAASDG